MSTDAPSYLQLVFNSLAAIGAGTGLVALSINLADRRIRLRVELGFADALVTNGLCIKYTIFNDGRDILLDDLGVGANGELPPEVEAAMAERYRTTPRHTKSDGKGFAIARGDKLAGEIPWAWGAFLQNKTPFHFFVTLRNGWTWNIPSNVMSTARFAGFVIQQPQFFPFRKPRLSGEKDTKNWH